MFPQDDPALRAMDYVMIGLDYATHFDNRPVIIKTISRTLIERKPIFYRGLGNRDNAPSQDHHSYWYLRNSYIVCWVKDGAPILTDSEIAEKWLAHYRSRQTIDLAQAAREMADRWWT